MKKGKFEKKSSFVFNKKMLALLLALVLVVGGMVGGTLAWLVDSSDKVTNTFTTSDIGVKLEENKNDFKMTPGWTIAKDPKVTVKAGSVDCWLFVKVEKQGSVTVGTGTDAKTYTFDAFIAYAIDSGWTAGNGTGEGKNGVPEGVYFRKVENVSSDTSYDVLASGSKEISGVTYSWDANQVLTLPTVTKEMMEAAGKAADTDKIALTFTAYASQLYKTNKPTGEGVTEEQITAAQFTAAEAWANVNPS